MVLINTFRTALLEQGTSPSVVASAPGFEAAIDQTELVGRALILADPGTFGLSAAPGVRLDDTFVEFSENATLDFTLQSSGDLDVWTDEATVQDVTIDISGDKRFFRLKAD
jgi:hypothetical protein